MIQLGKKQILKIVRQKEFGVYVGDETESVLLPSKDVPKQAKTGDELEVFVYRDSNDRLIATTRTPAVTLGEVALLEVKDTGKIGAFLDWGLEKDLFLPFKEQTMPLRPGKKVLAALYIDKSDRLCATMKIYDHLKTDAPYEKNAWVRGTVYQVNERFGVFVAVDERYHGLIPANLVHQPYRVGDEVEARVLNVREDGKLELSPRHRMDVQIGKDAETVMDVLDSYCGVLPFTEKAVPAVIERELAMSKAAFKRAVGHLLKEGKIVITDGKIRKKEDEDPTVRS